MTLRLALAGALLVLGLCAGLASVAIHDKGWAWFLLAVAAPLATSAAAAPGLPRGGFSLGWLVVLAIALGGRPEGDFAIQATARGYGLLASGVVLLGVAVATFPRPPRMAR